MKDFKVTYTNNEGNIEEFNQGAGSFNSCVGYVNRLYDVAEIISIVEVEYTPETLSEKNRCYLVDSRAMEG